MPWGSPRVSWLRNTALVAAVARKAETAKYSPWVTQAQNRTRAAPGPGGADGVTTTWKRQEHSWESCDAPAANWTMRGSGGFTGEGWALVSWGQMRRGDDTGVVLAHGYMELQWPRLPRREHTGKHTHHPALLDTRIGLQSERLLMEPRSGAAVAGNRMRKLWCWGDGVRVGHCHVEDDTSAVYGCPFRGLYMSVHLIRCI